jgi:hypothetical protein
MGMNNYRDLDPKERHEPGDEFKGHGGNWINCSDYAGDLVGTAHPCRRPITEAESPWIPISTPPTEDDGDANGQVLVRHGNESVNTWHWSRARGPHWMPIPPLPLPEPTKNERLAKRIAEAFNAQQKSTINRILDVINADSPE